MFKWIRNKASAGVQLKKSNTLLSVLVLLSVSSNAYGMQICQLSDTLVWDIEAGFDIDPKELKSIRPPMTSLLKMTCLPPRTN